MAHRGAASAGPSSCSSGGAAQLARLPPDVLHSILAQAAYPVSAWAPRMPSGQVLLEVAEFVEEVLAEEEADDWGGGVHGDFDAFGDMPHDEPDFGFGLF